MAVRTDWLFSQRPFDSAQNKCGRGTPGAKKDIFVSFCRQLPAAHPETDGHIFVFLLQLTEITVSVCHSKIIYIFVYFRQQTSSDTSGHATCVSFSKCCLPAVRRRHVDAEPETLREFRHLAFFFVPRRATGARRRHDTGAPGTCLQRTGKKATRRVEENRKKGRDSGGRMAGE